MKKFLKFVSLLGLGFAAQTLSAADNTSHCSTGPCHMMDALHNMSFGGGAKYKHSGDFSGWGGYIRADYRFHKLDGMICPKSGHYFGVEVNYLHSTGHEVASDLLASTKNIGAFVKLDQKIDGKLTEWPLLFTYTMKGSFGDFMNCDHDWMKRWFWALSAGIGPNFVHTKSTINQTSTEQATGEVKNAPTNYIKKHYTDFAGKVEGRLMFALTDCIALEASVAGLFSKKHDFGTDKVKLRSSGASLLVGLGLTCDL